MSIKSNFHHTLRASYLGYITQAVVNSLTPLLFLTFQKTYHISLNQIAFLVTINFGTQLMVDFFAAKFVDRIGYRICIVGAHLFAGTGLIGLSILPDLLSHPYTGLVLSVSCYAIGGGLIEVMLSPIVQACPVSQKSSAMCFLHSFNCWGQVLVVLISTLFFSIAGIEHWSWIVRMWACIPLLNALYFSAVPLRTLAEEERGASIREMCSMKLFWIFMLLMLCSGGAEQAMSQWASAFAEMGLHVSKTAGDLAGPCMFALLMGTSRIFYAKYSEKINLQKYILGSSILCVFSYLLTSLSPLPILSLLGCGLCGLSIGILWPGIYSMAAEHFSTGGTAMFALLALGGDIGCSTGPAVVGLVSASLDNNLKQGLLCAVVFPVLLTAGVVYLRRTAQERKRELVADCND